MKLALAAVLFAVLAAGCGSETQGAAPTPGSLVVNRKLAAQCPTRAPYLQARKNARGYVRFVHPDAVLVELCRYRGLNAALPLGLAQSRVIRHAVTIDKLTQELNSLPTRSGMFSCPFDEESEILLVFVHGDLRLERVTVGLRGCRIVTNGRFHTIAITPAGFRLVKQLLDLMAKRSPVVAAAQASDAKLFGIFPSNPGTRRCSIPAIEGMRQSHLRGTCSTSVSHPVTHGLRPEAFVSFRQSWGRSHTTWTVIVQLPSRKVVATHVSGAPAPQMRYATDRVANPRLLAGEVLVVASNGQIHICGSQGSDLMFGPPGCAPGPRVVGLRADMLPQHSSRPAESWGYPYLVGTYRDGTFYVVSQRSSAPKTPGKPFLETPPCPAPPGGWAYGAPDVAGREGVDHYFRLSHHHDLVGIAFFHGGTILTVASTHPARTRAVLERYLPPRQLCVVKARYSRAELLREGAQMVALIRRPDAAAFGWPSGGGGTTVSDRGQPMTNLIVLLVTPRLRAYLSRRPGLVSVQASLNPLR